MPDALVQHMAAIANPTLAKCDYDPIPIKEKERPEDARRRYALSLMMHAQRGTSSTD